ncbi:hypothetical protein NEOLEDRAFT_1081610 [Neolentinus lepideus HHB14362 ss-1]|uniref:Uncharacterized protein n=1 Tax=Neolentinus lepideus HHB14362 ss-1 TaxID=1314782 RepID=A0A165M6F8_9AGAM|nr:hypothetical protein NEOLEDRAFT_1081610 [Neolentinus lepideus HHB14362 ss-1]
MTKYRRRHKPRLERIKSIKCGTCKVKRNVLFSQCGQRDRNTRVCIYKTSIKVSKTEERLKLLDGGGCRPAGNVLNFGLIEDALLRTGAESSIAEAVQNEPDVFVVLFLGTRENEDVVQIDNTENVEEFTEGILNERLKSRGGISQTVRNNKMFKQSERGAECGLPLITLFNTDMAVSRFEIENRKYFTSLHAIEKVIDQQQRIAVLLGDGV